MYKYIFDIYIYTYCVLCIINIWYFSYHHYHLHNCVTYIPTKFPIFQRPVWRHQVCRGRHWVCPPNLPLSSLSHPRPVKTAVCWVPFLRISQGILPWYFNTLKDHFKFKTRLFFGVFKQQLYQQNRRKRKYELTELSKTLKWVFPKIGKHPKMDGENNGKPYFVMDDLGGFNPPIFGSTSSRVNDWCHCLGQMDPAANPRTPQDGGPVALRSMAWTACFSIFFKEALNHIRVFWPFFSWRSKFSPGPHHTGPRDLKKKKTEDV